MPAIMIVDVKEVWDKEAYAEYVRLVPQTVAKFGGRYLARGGAAENVAGDWIPGRVVLIEFDSKLQFDSWWNSPEYAAAKPLREKSARVDAIVVEGLSS